MTSKRLSKQQMREDQFRDFLSEFYFGSLAAIENHWQATLVGLCILLVAIGGGYFVWSREQAKTAKASYLLSKVMDAYSAPIETGKSAQSGEETFSTQQQRTAAVQSNLTNLETEVGERATGGLATLYKGLAQADAGNLADAVKTISPLTGRAKTAPLALPLRARLYEAMGEWDKAEADWKSLASLSAPTMPKGEGWFLLGKFYERRDQKDKAIQAYQEAEKAVPAAKDQEQQGVAQRAKTQLEALKGKA